MKCIVWTAVGTDHSVGVNTCSKLAGIGTIQGVESLHRHVIAMKCFVFVLPVSLGLDVLASCFFDGPSSSLSLSFSSLQNYLIYLASLVELDRLPLETELSLWGLWRRLITHTALSVVTCASKSMYTPTHNLRTSYSALAISIRLH